MSWRAMWQHSCWNGCRGNAVTSQRRRAHLSLFLGHFLLQPLDFGPQLRLPLAGRLGLAAGALKLRLQPLQLQVGHGVQTAGAPQGRPAALWRGGRTPSHWACTSMPISSQNAINRLKKYISLIAVWQTEEKPSVSSPTPVHRFQRMWRQLKLLT